MLPIPPIFNRPNITPPPIGVTPLSTAMPVFDANFYTHLFQGIMGWLFLILGLAAFGAVIYGAFRIIMAGPNPANVEEGRKIIIGALVAVVVVALSYLIILYLKSILENVVGAL